jgi:hypothetical protein
VGARRRRGQGLAAAARPVRRGFVADGDDGKIEEAATMRLRAEMKARRTVSSPMIDRGEGYEQMLRGECAPRMRKEA